MANIFGKDKEKQPIILPPMVWQCKKCKNVHGNYSHRVTCAACGEIMQA
jgi:Zn finger protein HypA/HybF involved in hydrogenase expression